MSRLERNVVIETLSMENAALFTDEVEQFAEAGGGFRGETTERLRQIRGHSCLEILYNSLQLLVIRVVH